MNEGIEIQKTVKIGFLDLETKKPIYRHLGDTPEKLGLAIAGLVINDQPIQFFTEDNIKDLFKILDGLDLIVGHNLLGFDYLVLQPYHHSDVVQKYSPKTFDTMKELEKVTGIWTKLDDLAFLNLGLTKTEDPSKIPLLWQQGQYNLVRSYLKNDVEMTKQLFHHGRAKGTIKYTHKEFGEVKGVRVIRVKWQ